MVIGNEGDGEEKDYLSKKGIQGGRKGIVAIRVSMTARDFQKCYGKWKPEGAVPLKQKASWF